jgi:hemerythrin-like metal-binding protein
MTIMDFAVVDFAEQLGHSELDRQHLVLVEAICGLRDAPRDRDRDLRAWERLVSVVHDHFVWEESEMRREKFPDLAAHKRDHTRQLMALNEHSARFRDSASFDLGALQAMEAWNGRHIRGRDREFAQFLQDPESWWVRRELAAWEDDRFLLRAG